MNTAWLLVLLFVALAVFFRSVIGVLAMWDAPRYDPYVVRVPPFPITFDAFLHYPFPLASIDMQLRGGDERDVATVYNRAGAIARMNQCEFRALVPAVCPNATR